MAVGGCEEMDTADFDFGSKVEPFQHALAECSKGILITVRMGQSAQRISLDVLEDGKCSGFRSSEWLLRRRTELHALQDGGLLPELQGYALRSTLAEPVRGGPYGPVPRPFGAGF